MKTKAAERRPASANTNLVQQRSDSQPFFQKHADKKSQTTSETAFFHTTVQAKLTIGNPGDKYEKEADAMADQVVNGQGALGPGSVQTGSPGLQSKCAACEKEGDKKEEEKIQAKALYPQISPLIQRQAETEEEEETIQRQAEEEEEMQPKLEVQRQAEEEEEEVQPKMEEEEEETIQRQEEEEEEMQPKLEVQRQAEEE